MQGIVTAQLQASDPLTSAWVAANAGTGKTKVLTDRVLRLLLAGAAMHRIVCITYTNAAAAEMASRIQTALATWAVIDEEKLSHSLMQLSGKAPGAATKVHARRLFAEVLESGRGLNIQTIHGFCQSVLRRFPLEAGVPPHFQVIDSRTSAELIGEARTQLLTDVRHHAESPLGQAIASLATETSEFTLSKITREVIGKRLVLEARLRRLPDDTEALRSQLFQEAGFAPDCADDQLLGECFCYGSGECDEWLSIAETLMQGGKNEQKAAERMRAWYRGQRRACDFWQAKGAYLTAEDKPLVKMLTDATRKTYPAWEERLRGEQRRFLHACQRLSELQAVRRQAAVLIYAGALLARYGAVKRQRAYLDFDDLILTTTRLLSGGENTPWVFFKLEGGIDHLLIDEAQDTSPQQWDLIKPLIAEFYTADRGGKLPRTLFVVGDEKQSIYSFQGAEPKAFGSIQDFFATTIRGAGYPFLPVRLTYSFRSTEAVLRVVDSVFAGKAAREGLTYQPGPVQHEARRTGQAGLVELWPLVPAEKTASPPPWTPYEPAAMAQSPTQRLATRIAGQVRTWLDTQRILPAQGRPVQPGDILILLRRRGPLMDAIVRALKARQVPVAGADRLKLGAHIAVQDMLALADFLLLPQDDMALAILLRSPLIGLGEEALYVLAQPRQGTLWEAVRDAADTEVATIARRIEGWLARVDYQAPYEFFAQVLEADGGWEGYAGRLGLEAIDPLREFLSLALTFEQAHVPSMEAFVRWFSAHDTEIKRDMEHGSNEVRLMTVHGAKGLQAPIVFLPDTTFAETSKDALLWEESGMPFWPAQPIAQTETIKARNQSERMAELRRLLYVALTRAQDELYICGVENIRSKEHWYGLIEAGFPEESETLDVTFADTDGDPARIRRLRSGQAVTVVEEPPQTVGIGMAPLPIAIAQPAAPESALRKPISPSRPAAETTPGRAPGDAAKDRQRFLRGRLIHQLLQWLPELPPEARLAAGELWLAHAAGEMEEAEREAVLSAVLGMVEDARFASAFAPGSVAEAPISGIVEGQAVSGQIDRLCVGAKEVLIVDFKSDRVPPAGEVPAAYRRQLALYKALLSRIYPQKRIRTALLWIEGPRWMEVEA